MAGLATTNELWYTVYYWLKTYGSKPNKNFCKQELTTHPDYPALTSVTDFLEMGGMTCSALQADASYIHEFNYPLLAHIKQPGIEQIHIINKATDWDAEKEITQHWTGVVIFAGRNARWQHAENDAHVKKQGRSRVNNALLFGMAIIFFSLAVLESPSFSFAFMGLLSLAGLMISIVIIGTELGVQGDFVKQVCGAVNSGGCDRVLKTSYAKGFAGFTTGDISVIYFIAQFSFLLSSVFFPALYNAVLMGSIAGLPVAAWSFYTQAVKVKQWCALCLGIVIVLLLQFTVAVLAIDGRQSFPSEYAVLFYSAFGLLTALFIYPIKQLLETNYANQTKTVELNKWRMDADLFLAQWSNSRSVDTSNGDNEILLGNSFAPLKITVACNPYCGPCATAHKKLDNMLQKFDETLQVQVKFLCDSTNEKDFRSIAVKAILEKSKEIPKHERIPPSNYILHNN